MLQPDKAPDEELDVLVAAHIKRPLGASPDDPTDAALGEAVGQGNWRGFVRYVREVWGALFHATSRPGQVSHNSVLTALLDTDLGPLGMASVPLFTTLLDSQAWKSGEWQRVFGDFVLALPGWEGTYHDILTMVDQNLAKGGQRATWSEGLIRVFKLFALLFLYAIVRGGVATRWPLAKGRFSQSLIHLARDLQRFSQIRIRQLIFENHDHLALDDRWALSAKRLDLQERWATIREISSGRMRDLELGRLLGYVEALYSVVIGPYAQLVPPGALEELARDTNALTLVPIPEDTRDGPWGQIFDQQGKDE